MRLWLAILLLLVPVVGDGGPNDEDIPATFAANKVVGSVYPQGADVPEQSFVDSVSRTTVLTLNSDPSSGAVGFQTGLQRGIQTGVLNGDFSMPPPDITAPISASNSLPYWTWTPDGSGIASLALVADTSAASGYKATFTLSGTLASTAAGQQLYQLVPVPMSQGQQYRVLLSTYVSTASFASMGMYYQFYKADGVTAIGSEVLWGSGTGGVEKKGDAGLVPSTAAYLRLRFIPTSSAADTISIFESRAAFLPAEATVGLGSLSAPTGGITTTETQVKGITIPANTLVVGSVYRIEAWATMTSSAANVVTFRMRLGPTTLTGTVVDSINPTATTTASSDSFKIEALLTVRSVGATGAVTGGISMMGGASQPFAVATRIDQLTGTVTIDTTAANILELTAQTAAGTTTVTFRQAVITCLMAS